MTRPIPLPAPAPEPGLALATVGCRDSTAGSGGGSLDGGQDRAAAADLGTIVDADCPTDGPGGGVCPVNFCGYLTSAAAPVASARAQGGADSVCNRGRICLATVVVASGTALQLSCLPPRAGG